MNAARTGTAIRSNDYHDYVIKDGRFVGEFEQMYRNVEDPWHCSELAQNFDNALVLAAVAHAGRASRTVLEVGCGIGAITRRIVEALPHARIHACDISPTAIAKAERVNPTVRFFTHDLCGDEPLPLDARSVDLIVMVQVMWYILPALERTFAAYHTLLAAGGHLIVSQAFYPSVVQKYGRGTLETAADVRRYLDTAGFTLRSEIHIDPSVEMGRPHNSLFWATPR